MNNSFVIILFPASPGSSYGAMMEVTEWFASQQIRNSVVRDEYYMIA